MNVDVGIQSANFSFLMILLNLKERKGTKNSNRYNQVPNLTQDTKWESNTNNNSTPQTRAKRSALSP